MTHHPVCLQQLMQLADIPPSSTCYLPAALLQQQVSEVTSDSRKVCPGAIFVAVAGSRFDGHDFLKDAATAGGICAIVETVDASVSIAQIAVPSTATALAKLCMKRSMGSQSIQTVGITGTNGKTTTTWMLQAILEQAGLQTGRIGTISHHDGLRDVSSTMTTPDAETLGSLFGNMVRHRTSHCAMEISSHALAQNRAAGLQLSAAAITNITQDHFDYHGDVDSYQTAKASIAELLGPEAPLLLNVDDPGCRHVQQKLNAETRVVTCGIKDSTAELKGDVLRSTHRSTTIRLRLAQGDCDVRLKMIGEHNVSNCLIAAGLAEQMGIAADSIVEGLQSLESVPGRLQRIDRGQSFQLFIDYAHTPDALRHCLQTVRGFTVGRVICVFGAGGDRDRSKRSAMGNAASVADRCIVTSDNPRTEHPDVIIQDVIEGIHEGVSTRCVVDRATAIMTAIAEADVGDCVVIAGRGHETSQEINGRQIPFSDTDVAVAALDAVFRGDAYSTFARSA